MPYTMLSLITDQWIPTRLNLEVVLQASYPSRLTSVGGSCHIGSGEPWVGSLLGVETKVGRRVLQNLQRYTKHKNLKMNSFIVSVLFLWAPATAFVLCPAPFVVTRSCMASNDDNNNASPAPSETTESAYGSLLKKTLDDVIKRYSESCRIIECELISEKLYFGIFVRYRRILIVVVYRPR